LATYNIYRFRIFADYKNHLIAAEKSALHARRNFSSYEWKIANIFNPTRLSMEISE